MFLMKQTSQASTPDVATCRGVLHLLLHPTAVSSLFAAAEVLDKLPIPPGTQRVLFKTVNSAK